MAGGHRYELGKVDYNGSGRRNCKAVITWDLENGRFSMQAEIWNPRETDCYACGQCVEEVAAYFPSDAKAQRMLAIWRDWHLNDMRAGSPAQEAWLRENPVTAVYPGSHYETAKAALAAAGLQPDTSYIHNGNPYSYGSAWLRRELPPEVVAEIESWDA
jgi:hypothetical protein